MGDSPVFGQSEADSNLVSFGMATAVAPSYLLMGFTVGAVTFTYEGLLGYVHDTDLPFFLQQTPNPDLDLEPFFDTASYGTHMGFAQDLIHSGTTYDAIFTETSTFGTEREGPMVWMRSSDVDGTISRGDTVNVGGDDYTVEGIQPDGTGISMLVLIPT